MVRRSRPRLTAGSSSLTVVDFSSLQKLYWQSADDVGFCCPPLAGQDKTGHKTVMTNMCTEVINGWGRTPEHKEINRCNTHTLALYKPRAGLDNQCLKHDDVHVSITDQRTHDYTVHYSALAEDLPVMVFQLNSITPCSYRMDELCM